MPIFLYMKTTKLQFKIQTLVPKNIFQKVNDFIHHNHALKKVFTIIY